MEGFFLEESKKLKITEKQKPVVQCHNTNRLLFDIKMSLFATMECLMIQHFHCLSEVLTSCGDTKPTQRAVRYSLPHLKEELKPYFYYIRYCIASFGYKTLFLSLPLPFFKCCLCKLVEKVTFSTHPWAALDTLMDFIAKFTLLWVLKDVLKKSFIIFLQESPTCVHQSARIPKCYGVNLQLIFPIVECSNIPLPLFM